MFLNYLGVSKDSIRRTPGRGIYTSYSFGDPSTHKTVRAIFLDVRYNKSSALDAQPDILGEEQWQWFENEIKDNHETFTFIISGSQILNFNKLLGEVWFSYPRKRLFEILGKYKKSGAVLLSGDIHCGQVLKTFCVMPEIGYDLWEITSSGLSHYDRDQFITDYLLPNDYSVLPAINTYNYANVEISWGKSKEESSLQFQIRDIDNNIRAQIDLNYAEDLIYSEEKVKVTDKDCFNKSISRFKSLSEYFQYYRNHKLAIMFILPYLWMLNLLFFFIYIPYRIAKFIFYFLIGKGKKNTVKSSQLLTHEENQELKNINRKSN
jgi:hypothetical protein